jgi:hypothetical protein
MAADEPAGEAVDELMKPQVWRSNHGSRRLVHDAVYDEDVLVESPDLDVLTGSSRGNPKP